MTIIVKDAVWHQTEETVNVTIPIGCVPASKVDVFVSAEYVKVSFAPYLFEAFLRHPVVATGTKNLPPPEALFEDGELHLRMHKESAGVWESYTRNYLSSEGKSLIRSKALEDARQQQAKNEEAAISKKRTRERESISNSLANEDRQRAELAQRKELERAKFLASEAPTKAEVKAICPPPQSGYNSILAGKVAMENESLRRLPPPREPAVIEVAFTPRQNRAPKRDTELDREMEANWHKKLHESKRRPDADAETKRAPSDLSERDRDLGYLLGRGKSFFEAGDYASAAEVYSHGIKMYPKHVPFYNNRCACYLKLNEMKGALSDAESAIGLLEPAVAANARDRAKAHARRATALVSLGDDTAALEAMDHAVACMPDDAQLRADRERIKKRIAPEE